ncbi:MAG TPA: DUF1573 domain-containing protein [Ignavibacteria bacterium]|nr:DUF1573 domain-containing protein [Ignavibacteria bacterium]
MKTTIKKSFYFAFLTFVFASISGSSSTFHTEKETKAQINFKKIFHDFGKVEEGTELSYKFKFKNTGKENLIINSVNAGCGCTGVQLGDKKEYKKEEEGEILITLNTQGRFGEIKKSVSVQTNDLEKPNIELTFSCEVIEKK